MTPSPKERHSTTAVFRSKAPPGTGAFFSFALPRYPENSAHLQEQNRPQGFQEPARPAANGKMSPPFNDIYYWGRRTGRVKMWYRQAMFAFNPGILDAEKANIA